MASETIFKCDKCGAKIDCSYIKPNSQRRYEYTPFHIVYMPSQAGVVCFAINCWDRDKRYDELCESCLIELLRTTADCIENGAKIEHRSRW
jgi:hypothetical protein